MGEYGYDGDDFKIISFTTNYLEMPLEGSKTVAFPMTNDYFYEPEYTYSVDYSIIDVTGSYIPEPTENASDYLD